MDPRSDAATTVTIPESTSRAPDLWLEHPETRRTVIAVAAHIVGDTATAEDIASEAFERLARQTVDVRDKEAWLRTVAYRSALNELRRREREERAHRRAASEAPAPRMPEELIDDGDRCVAAAVARLPPQQKAAALLCWGDGLSVGEAAAVMGCAVATVRVHLFRARRTLQPMFRDDEGTRS